jgi:hypothetical protein
MATNLVNMDNGDALTWVPLWKLFAYTILLLNYPFSWSGLNLGRISMFTNGFVKNSENNMLHLIPCVTQNMEKGAWNKWGAQMIYYTTALKGITNLYEASNAMTYGIASFIFPIVSWGGGNFANLFKFVADVCGLLVWSNMT